MIFDTHAHYDDEQFDGDRESLLESMAENGVGTIVNVCAAYESCERVIAMAEKYPFMYAAVGVHPDEVGSLDEERFSRMKELFKNEKVVAVGEIGLDYYWDNESHDVQKKWFIRQLGLARELNLPVVQMHMNQPVLSGKNMGKIRFSNGGVMSGIISQSKSRTF